MMDGIVTPSCTVGDPDRSSQRRKRLYQRLGRMIARSMLSSAGFLRRGGRRSGAGAACRPGSWIDPGDRCRVRTTRSSPAPRREAWCSSGRPTTMPSITAGSSPSWPACWRPGARPRHRIRGAAAPRRSRSSTAGSPASSTRPRSWMSVGWRRIWGLPAELYLPLFHFARLLPPAGAGPERRPRASSAASAARAGPPSPLPSGKASATRQRRMPAYVDRLALHFRGHALRTARGQSWAIPPSAASSRRSSSGTGRWRRRWRGASRYRAAGGRHHRQRASAPSRRRPASARGTGRPRRRRAPA